MNSSAFNSPAVFVSTFSVGLFADLSTKFAARSFLSEDIPFLGGWITLRHAENPGIAFWAPLTGLPLKIVTVALIALVGYYYFRHELLRGKLAVDAAYGAFLAGAVGNGYERLAHGKVTDFIDGKYFAIFNVADIIITLSAAALVAIHLSHERNRKR